jgi:hypothetical protein
MQASQPYRILDAVTRVAEIIDEALDDISVLDDRYEELICLRPWLMTERFDRRALNKALAGLTEPEVTAA